MTETTVQRPSLVVRLIHGALIAGVVLFAAVTHFLIRPVRPAQPEIPPIFILTLLVAAVVASGAALVVRRRVPQRNTDESSDLFWTTAIAPALVTWSLIEGAGLLTVVAYLLTGQPMSLWITGLALALMLVLNPGRMER